MLIPGQPRASWTNLLASSPVVVMGLASSATAVDNHKTVNNANGTTGAGINASGLMAFDGTNWRRLNNGPAVDASVGTGTLAVLSMLRESSTIFNVPSAAVAASDGTAGARIQTSLPNFFNGTTFDRARNNAAANISATTQPFAQQTADPGEWAVEDSPAAGTDAVATKAAGAAGVRHVCRSISVSIANTSVAVTGLITVTLLDGATPLRSWVVSVLVNDSKSIDLSGLNMVGTAATAMTVQTAGVGPNVIATANISGYSTI